MGMAENTRERGREQAGMTREGRRTMEKVLENTVRDTLDGLFWLSRSQYVFFTFEFLIY